MFFKLQFISGGNFVCLFLLLFAFFFFFFLQQLFPGLIFMFHYFLLGYLFLGCNLLLWLRNNPLFFSKDHLSTAARAFARVDGTVSSVGPVGHLGGFVLLDVLHESTSKPLCSTLL